MAKNTETETVTAAQEQAPTLTIREFCSQLSEKDTRVELISAFCSVESSAGRLVDTYDGFTARYESFINQPA